MMSALVANPWVVVVGSAAVALLVALAGRRAPLITPWVAMLGPSVAVVLGAASLVAIQGEPERAPWTSELASRGSVSWFTIAGTSIDIGWAVDSLAAIMLLVVGVVAVMVMLFSIGYMHGDRGWVRYYALLGLFTAAMSLLVIADSFVTLFIGWELVGATSYLLIGFWFEKPSASRAAVKAFLTTRVGDVGLMFGLAMLWVATGSLEYETALGSLGGVAQPVVALAAILVAFGAIGKSAQFPLHAWLPDAMEGPTPVSALIHAATMVAAGVYLVARTWPLFEAAPQAQLLLLAVGVISSAGAALAAIAQTDIKKVLAYSTISQLGLMFAALGVGAWVPAMFHLVTHAAFKALLFLTAGSVIHGSGTQELREMGGLRKAMPFTFAAWLVGVLALSGIPVLSGFFSKDAVLEAVWHAEPLFAVLLFAGGALTAFYSARATRLAFFGSTAPGAHAHESPVSMLVPLGVLGVLATVLGFAAAPFSEALGHEPEPLALAISVVAVALAVIGGALGWVVSAGREADERFESQLGGAWPMLRGAFGWDALMTAFARNVADGCRVVWAFGDRLIIDGIVEGTAVVARWAGGLVSRLQSGDAQAYATALAVTIAFLLAASALTGVIR